jgi:GT2 family glycosyltransferase
MNTLSIIIPIYNRKDITLAGLRSLTAAIDYYKQEAKGSNVYDIVIVDDGSTDGSAEAILTNYPICTVLRGDGNLWWSGSINLGIEHVLRTGGVSHVILWNDDTACALNYFANVDPYLSQSPYRESILTSKVLWEDSRDTLMNYGCAFNFKTGKTVVIGLNQKDGEAYSKPLAIDWSGGMGTIIPVNIIRTIGLLDSKNFPQYHGDKDFFLRARRHGFSAFVLPDLMLWNNRFSTGERLKRPYTKSLIRCLTSQRSQYNFRENFIFLKKHTPNLTSFYFFCRYYFGFFIAYLKGIFRLKELKAYLLSVKNDAI